jgi:hypothetical protein
MRVSLAGLFLIALGASGCGLLAGLGDYSAGDPIESDSLTDSSPFTMLPGSDDAEDASADTSSGDDGSSVIEDPDGDASAPCGPGNCGGCCINGTCAGGGSVDTCGSGGVACVDCTSMGGACSAAGACTTPPKDAAPPAMCVVSACKSKCIPYVQNPCCKSDQTCGCAIAISSTCN